jgi:LmbE family N-acetylglucosaminyl deacetylase
MNIIAIFAHPDDAEMSCGGSLANLARLGNKIYLIYLSLGENGGKKEARQKELEEATKIIGGQAADCLYQKDGNISCNLQLISLLRDKAKKIAPELIYTHFPNDLHQDHRATYEIVISATRNFDSGILLSEGTTTINFFPTFYQDISETLEMKLKALAQHQSQISRGAFELNEIKTLAEIRGRQAKVKYAEGFIPFKFIWKP